ncbi:class II aldolase/adducin family protein [Noviherbaspirillum sp. Root189]|uniref:class II aldolase/adducin family protein n=1 Tax=Noviherbaspirillum sp. Root189 TaxID=1736487 RepID=UPI002E0D1F73
MGFHDQLGYHTYEGLALSPSEQRRFVDRLGGYPAMMLRNHGTLVCGRTVAEANVLMESLDKACEIQLNTGWRCKAGSARSRDLRQNTPRTAR